ncbi:MAG TPA: cytidylate kinase family protein [Anaerohalosphaeraceae bacterium]|nr:cytidylate kinase family protein [Anaerohalosphaeraceae bacterium]
MTKPNLSSYLRQHLDQIGAKKEPGLYITISRQWGCDGIGLGQILVERLNQRDSQQRWKLYHKELLAQLAKDTGLTEEILEKERISKPNLLKDFLRGLTKNSIPDGFEVRNKITMMVRTIAFEGYAVIIGQGGTAATGDLANGLSIRVEAPREWRIARICLRENLDKQAAAAKIAEIEKQREHLRKIYERQNPREPAFNIVFDNSVFTNEQIADHIILAMEQRNMIEEEEEEGKFGN